MKKKRTIYEIPYLPVCYIILIAVLFCYPVIFNGLTFYAFDTLSDYLPWSASARHVPVNNPLLTDPINQGYPLQQFIRDCLKKDFLPLWNNLNFSGLPLTANWSSRLFSPFFLFNAIGSVALAHDLLLFSCLICSGLFMYYYLREISLGNVAALIGAVSWMFNGYIMVWFEFEFIPILAFSLPASCLFIERWFKKRGLLDLLLFVICCGFAISSGFAHGVIYQMIFLGCYLLFRLSLKIKDQESMPFNANDGWQWGTAILLGVLISATFLIAHLQLLEVSQRDAFSFKELYLKTGQLPVKYFITMIFPDFFGSPTLASYFPPRKSPSQIYNNYNELCIYSGIATLFFVISAVFHCRDNKHTFYYIFSCFVTLTMAMGSIMYWPFAKFIPGLGFSTPTRLLFLFAFSFCILSAFGVNVLFNGPKRKKSVFMVWSMLVLFAVTITWFLNTQTGLNWAAWEFIGVMNGTISAVLKQYFSYTSFIICKPLIIIFILYFLLSGILFVQHEKAKRWFWLGCICVLSYDLLSFGMGYNTLSPKESAYPKTHAIDFLKGDPSIFRVGIGFRIGTGGSFSNNFLAPFGIEDIGGYSSFYPRSYGEFLHLAKYGPVVPAPDTFSRWVFPIKLDSHLFDLINTKYFLLPPSFETDNPGFKLVYDGEIKIYENVGYFPRFFIVPEYESVSSHKKAYAKLGQYTVEDFKKKVILETDPEDIPESSSFSSSSSAFEEKVEVKQYTTSKVHLNVSTPQSGFLIVGNNFNPSWQAVIDGKKAKLLRANYIMSALKLSPGTHDIFLSYKPTVLLASIYLTVFGWSILIISTIFLGIKRSQMK